MKLTDLNDPKYIAFETFKKNGDAVNTPLWVAEKGDTLYAWTQAGSWKVKRVRNNPKVRLAISNGSGKPSGEWMKAQARILDAPDEVENVRQMIAKKYGFSYWLITLFTWFSRRNKLAVGIEIQNIE